MLKHFEAINVQEPKDCGTPPAGALSVLGPVIQPKACVPKSARLQLPAPGFPGLPSLMPWEQPAPCPYLGGQRPIDLPDQPGESATVHSFGKSISRICGLFQVQRAQELQTQHESRRWIQKTPSHAPPLWAHTEHQGNYDYSVLAPGGVRKGTRGKHKATLEERWHRDKKPHS